MTYALHHGDCLDILPTLDAGMFDALICDPPAGISFMGAAWDGHKGGRDQWIAWLAERMQAARRVVKPGHYALVWALPRTSHWTATACEDAGWVIEDSITHLYAAGSDDDDAAFLESLTPAQRAAYARLRGDTAIVQQVFGSGFPKNKNKLKPACEFWLLLRNGGPSRGLEIDRARITTGEDLARVNSGIDALSWGGTYGAGPNAAARRKIEGLPPAGRWPSHLLLSHAPGCEPIGVRRVHTGVYVGHNRDDSQDCGGYSGGWRKDTRDISYADADGMETVAAYACVEGCPVRALDAASGVRRPAGKYTKNPDTPGGYNGRIGRDVVGPMYADTGTASRFFTRFDPPFTYAPKASRSERDRGLAEFYWAKDDTRESKHRRITRAAWECLAESARARGNIHPTVKNLQLCRWLIGLVTDPGDAVLDLFAGTGAIGVAALETGRTFVGVELNEDYCAIGDARLRATADPLLTMREAR